MCPFLNSLAMKNHPHNILKEDNGDSATLYLYGYIGQEEWWGDGETDITDVAFLRALKDYEKAGKMRVDVRINSYGGSMLHMDGIVSLMQSSKMEIHTWVDGVAASAAATVFLAAPKERRHMAKNSKLMLHSPSGGAYGSAQVLRDAADMLDAYEEGVISQLANDTGQTEEEVKAAYFDGNDHWYAASQCVEQGFVNSLEEYNAENVPTSPENMTQADFEKFFQPTAQKDAVGFFKKLYHAAFPNNSHREAEPAASSIPSQKEEIMNIENLKTSLDSEEIKEADVVALLQEKGYEVQKPAAAAESEEVDIAKMVADAVAPLKTELATMQAKLDKTPASGPTTPQASTDPPNGENTPDLLTQQAQEHADLAKEWKNPFARQ